MTKPIKVLDLRDSGWVDGPGRTVLDTASSIDQSRCRLVVGSFVRGDEPENEYIKEARRRELRVETLRERKSLDPDVIRQIAAIVLRDSIDLIHTHDFRSNLFGLYCAKRLHLPVLTTCHGWIANDLKGRFYTAVDQFLLRFFDQVIVVSKVMKDRLVARGLPEQDITVVQNALVVENFTPCSEDQEFREELGLNPSTKIVVNIGRLSAEKGQREFIHAARELVKVFKDLHFVVVGAGEDERLLRELVMSGELSDYVSFVGYRKDMVSVYNSADLVVQSSLTEGMPNVILEALLMETPVVATDVGGTREILDDGAFGRLVQPEDSQQLERAIADFLRGPDELRERAEHGRRSVIERFNHDSRVEALSRIYEKFRGRNS